MTRPCRPWLPAMLMLLLAFAGPAGARAQHGGGGPGGGGHGIGGGGFGGPPPGGSGFPGGEPGPGMDGSRRGSGPPPTGPDSAGTVSTMRPGLQLGPPGRWWDDRHFAKDLKLRPDQQRHMDAIFESSRPALLSRLEALQTEQNRMEALTRARNLDENALFSQIDRIAQARADLEKATTHMMLQLRGEMDAGQLARLEDHRQPPQP